MTSQEAIKRIKEHILLHSIKEKNKHLFYINKALSMAVSALEKQIPEKPIGDLHSVPHYRCPNCKCTVKLYEDSPVYPHCQYCGKALEWGKDIV